MQSQRSAPVAQRGVAATEFALAAPLIIVLLFGMLEFGLAIYTKGLIANASREGARFGVIYSSPRKTQGEIQAVVQDYLERAGFTDPADINITGAQGSTGSPLSVDVNYPYNLQVLPNFVAEITGPINLKANSTMLME
ncbi:MAG: TadE/TadG family type IV pilus assembly protein [Thermodesulfobacteriota bacterium]